MTSKLNPTTSSDAFVELVETMDDGPWYMGKLGSSERLHTRENCRHVVNSEYDKRCASINTIRYHELTECTDCYLIRTHNVQDLSNLDPDGHTRFPVRFSQTDKEQLAGIVERDDTHDDLNDIIVGLVDEYFNGSFTPADVPRRLDCPEVYRTKLKLDNSLYKQVLQSVYDGDFSDQATVIRTLIRSYLARQDAPPITHTKKSAD